MKINAVPFFAAGTVRGEKPTKKKNADGTYAFTFNFTFLPPRATNATKKKRTKRSKP